MSNGWGLVENACIGVPACFSDIVSYGLKKLRKQFVVCFFLRAVRYYDCPYSYRAGRGATAVDRTVATVAGREECYY